LKARWHLFKKSKFAGWLVSALIILFTWYVFALPKNLFEVPHSTVLEDRHGAVLNVAIAADGQWRFPVDTVELPDKFKQALITFEDKRFYSHVGVDFFALARAIKQNIGARKVVSGGSTITMQVLRLARHQKSRNIWNKLMEIMLATRLEWRASKDEILKLYATHAPFGGNVVGLNAACARYFGNRAQELSWAEAATLAVLPNEPALIHPGRNRDKLMHKRNRLLIKLLQTNQIDSLTYSISIEEPLPEEPLPMPNVAPHLLWRAVADGRAQQYVHSTIDQKIQFQASTVLQRHAERLMANHVYNGAVLIADVKTGHVRAYVGNMATSRNHQEQVDIIQAPRSTGSILKPFLYAAMLDEGKLLPRTLVPDIPIDWAGFAPENFTRQFSGAVPAHDALIRSLNIPAVYELRDYRYEKFHSLLRQVGMTTLKPNPSHYGLTLILGGAEGTLWEVTGMYASTGRMLLHYFDRAGKNRYHDSDVHPLQYIAATSSSPITPLNETGVFSAGALFTMFHALQEVYRPGEESGWRNFSSSKPIAWKTGTSLGHRDAWAIGITPDFVVGVWVGNADGEGRPGLTGTEYAAPIMLDVFSSLSGNSWFSKPQSSLVTLPVCGLSGMRAGKWCTPLDTMDCPPAGINTLACTYHKVVHLSLDKKYQLNSQCSATDQWVNQGWFVLPPVQEYYFKQQHPSYKTLPPYRSDCANPQHLAALDVVYPKSSSKLYLPKELDGRIGKLVFEVTHRQRNARVFWHLNGEFIGQTQHLHQLAVTLQAGQHTLTVIDESGELAERVFTVLANP
jgi:penicillin-binding protein 1C